MSGLDEMRQEVSRRGQAYADRKRILRDVRAGLKKLEKDARKAHQLIKDMEDPDEDPRLFEKAMAYFDDEVDEDRYQLLEYYFS